MENWQKQLKYDPLPKLLSSEDAAVQYLTKRDLLEKQVGSVHSLWDLPAAQKILKKQKSDGSWPRSGEQKHTAINYSLIETWRFFRFLVEKYEFTREHPQAEKAAEYLLSCQTDAGDIRGFLANQYATYYTGAIMALLIKAGYANDFRIRKGFDWLLTMRQDDFGWTVPLITHKFDRETQYRLTSEFAKPVEPDRTKPFSHNWTGMVLRAFAAHEIYRKSEAAIKAANLLKSRFFQKDFYSSYQAASYWVRFEYPFWWNNLVAALDSISLIGVSQDDQQIQQALKWLIDHQEPNGLWKVTYAKAQEKDTAKNREMQLWITLAICRIFKRLSE
ncbi:MAG: hypothetical protein CL609_03585 [Anaerolineaceae bacterium]|nr:hypothetical protein [Anaerolineaceae bacterium]